MFDLNMGNYLFRDLMRWEARRLPYIKWYAFLIVKEGQVYFNILRLPLLCEDSGWWGGELPLQDQPGDMVSCVSPVGAG